MGSQISIRQLRRSSVNARPRGATLRGLVVSAVFTNAWAIFPPLCRFSVSKRSPGVRAQPWGCVRLSRDISSGFSDSLFFPSALFNSPVASGRPVSTFRKVLRQVFTGSRTRWVRSPAYDRSPDSGSGRAPGVRNRSRRSPPSPSPSDAFSGDFSKAYQRRARFPQGVRGDPEGPVRGRLYEGSPAWNPHLAIMFRDERPGKR